MYHQENLKSKFAEYFGGIFVGRPRIAKPEDRLLAISAHNQGKLGVSWSPFSGTMTPREWVKKHGWEIPFLDFKKAFIDKLLETDENFELALTHSGIDVYIPAE